MTGARLSTCIGPTSMLLQNLTRKMKWFNNAAYKAGMRSSSGRGNVFLLFFVLCRLQL